MSTNTFPPHPVFSSSNPNPPQNFFDSEEIQEYWRNQDVPQGNVVHSVNGKEEEEQQAAEKNEQVANEEDSAITQKKKERNRVLARETRMRKKYFFESLQKQVQDLVKENTHLKSLVKTLHPSVGDKIMAECCTKLPDIVAAVANQATSVLARADSSLITAICSAQRSFCITDPALPDNPIVFASQDFLDLTGYTMEETLGRNCRFLQGPATDLAGVAVLRQGIGQGIDSSVMLLNYKKDGTTFWNQIYCSALRDSDGNIVNYVGVQIEVLPPQLQQSESSKDAQEGGKSNKKAKIA